MMGNIFLWNVFCFFGYVFSWKFQVVGVFLEFFLMVVMFVFSLVTTNYYSFFLL